MSVSPISPDEASRFATLKQKEKELTDNILTTEKNTKLAQEAGEKRLQDIQDYYVELAKKEQDKGDQALSEQKAKNYEELRNLKLSQHAQNKKTAALLESQKAALIKKNRDILDQENQELNSRQLELQLDSEDNLNAYKFIHQDPFYKIRTLNSKLTENSREFILKIEIPQHEQNHIVGTVRGNQLVVSGYRRHEESLEKNPGHQQTTHSYQTFSESFPLSHPVDPKKLSREVNKDHIILRVPKLTGYTQEQSHHPKLEPTQSKKPDLPEDIYISTYQNDLDL